jgi:NAD(P)-dependent dehydrogenase (short-subunit alcohol dehydrogenase family)
MDLKNKIAIVTGPSMGIGKSIAVALAKEDSKVVLAAGPLDKLYGDLKGLYIGCLKNLINLRYRF